jgi:hypothetical protein
MAIYHLHPLTGDPGLCRATAGRCPFGSKEEHYSSAEEARAAFEEQQTSPQALAGATLTPLGKQDALRPVFSPRPGILRSGFTLSSDATPETKNRGEYSELYATQLLLMEQGFTTASGTSLEVESMVVGPVAYRKIGQRVLAENQQGEQAWLTAHADNAALMLRGILGGEGRTFFSAEMQAGAVTMGFTDGRVPKALSSGKTDVVVFDRQGQRRNISIKSHLGRIPAIINASKSSYIGYSMAIPRRMSKAEAEAAVASISRSYRSAAHRVAALKELGVTFAPRRGSFTKEGLGEQLNTVHPQAEAAYAAHLYAMADRSYTPPEKLAPAYRALLGAFARRFNHSSGFVQAGTEVTDMLVVHRSGEATLHSARTDAEAGALLAPKVRMEEHIARFPSELTIKDGKIHLQLNAVFSASL